MSSVSDRKLFNYLCEQLGSPYAATMYIASEARRRRESLNYYVLDSQVLSWVVSGDKPKPLPKHNKPRSSKYSPIYDVLELVDDIDVRCAVLSSLSSSIINYLSNTTFHKYGNIPSDLTIKFMNDFILNNSPSERWLIFEYENINDRFRESRVRILTRMIWNKFPT